VSPRPNWYPSPASEGTLSPAGEGVEGSQFGRLACLATYKEDEYESNKQCPLCFWASQYRTTRGGSKCRVAVYFLSSCLVLPPLPWSMGLPSVILLSLTLSSLCFAGRISQSILKRGALYVVFVLPTLRGSGFYKNTTVLINGVQGAPLCQNVTQTHPNSLPSVPIFNQPILIHGHILDKPSYWTLCFFSMSLPIPADGRRGEGDEAKEDDIKKTVFLFQYILFT
jgi:hypothetical protein